MCGDLEKKAFINELKHENRVEKVCIGKANKEKKEERRRHG
jgi:hypothetical protein